MKINAVYNQSGETAPSILELSNTFLKTSLSRFAQGVYHLNFLDINDEIIENALENKIVASPQDQTKNTNINDISYYLRVYKLDDSTVEISTISDGFETIDDCLTAKFIQIYFQ